MYRKFYLWLSLLSSVILFIFLVLAGNREVSPEWATYQQQYKKLLLEKAGDDGARAKARALTPEIQQLYLADLGRLDRCTNCHLGVENPLMAGAAVPFKPHSGDYLKYHPPERYGCTICHNGQGRATNKKEAHGFAHDAHWDRPLIPFSYIQSACAACHDLKALPGKGGMKVSKGHELFLERGCKGCHKLDGVGGVLGKALDGVGSQPVAYFPMKHVEGERTLYSWMKEHFDDPRNIVMGSQMLAILSDEESNLLTTYVLSLRAEEVPKKYRRITGEEAGSAMAESTGEALYKMYCIACHTTGKESTYDAVFNRTIPAIMNPAFLRAADDGYLKTVLSEGRADTPMTAWKAEAAGLPEKDLNRILGYVTRNRPKDRPKPFGLAGFNGNAVQGETLYKVRCMSCHGDKGQGGVGLNLRNPVVQKADPEFLALTVRDGREGTHMAPFGKKGVGLGDPDIADVVAFVRTLAGKK
jgi:mono/diheme cytochrome c family protein